MFCSDNSCYFSRARRKHAGTNFWKKSDHGTKKKTLNPPAFQTRIIYSSHKRGVLGALSTGRMMNLMIQNGIESSTLMDNYTCDVIVI